MNLTFKQRVTRAPGVPGHWHTVAVWPDSGGTPHRDDFVRINDVEQRVILTVWTGPTSAEVYTEDTYRRTAPEEVSLP